MKSKKSMSVFLVALVLGGAQTHRAFADGGAIPPLDKTTEIDISEKSGDRKYELNASASNAVQKIYLLTENSYLLNESVAGNSQAGAADETARGAIELNGFYTLTITRVSETEVSLRLNNLRLQLPDGLRSYSDEVSTTAKFTDGNWSDYVAGKPVELQMRGKGLAEFNHDFSREMMSSLETEIQAGAAAHGVPSSFQERIKNVSTQFDGATLAGTLERLNQKYDLDITGRLELKGSIDQ